MKTKFFAIIGLCLVFVVAGCIHRETLTPVAIASITPTEIIASTPTVAPSTIVANCLNIGPDFSVKLESEGTLIFRREVNRGNGLVRYVIYGMDLETKELVKIPQPNENAFGISVSPNSKLMAYLDLSSENGWNLVIATSSGEQIKIIPWEREWAGIVAWLDDQNLAIGTIVEKNEHEDNAAAAFSTFMILNPFTGERQMLYPNFPNIYNYYPLINRWSGWGETAYDPTLSRVVYFQSEPAGAGPFQYVLWDIEQNESLASFEVFFEANSIPRWSPDGEKFIFAWSPLAPDMQGTWPAYELYSVSREGQITQLTNLTAQYHWTYIDDYNWSPNNRYIAFWFSQWSDEKPDFSLRSSRYLAILDTENNMVTDYCIPGDFDATNGSRRVPPPIWSPDSKSIVIQNQYSDTDSRVILINIEQNTAVIIGENMKPEGWMLSAP